jgi:hypothetical protein
MLVVLKSSIRAELLGLNENTLKSSMPGLSAEVEHCSLILDGRHQTRRKITICPSATAANTSHDGGLRLALQAEK